MMHSVILPEDANSSSDESTNDHPSTSGRQVPLASHSSDTDGPTTHRADDSTLPRLADNSWIGARVSPIPSVDEEDDEDDWELDRITAPYRNAIRESRAHERSSLLGKGGIHPMWKTNPGTNGYNLPYNELKTIQAGGDRRPPIWGKIVVTASGMHFFCMVLHDAYLFYLQVRRDIIPQYPIGWSLPWLGPSSRILLRFGAFCPQRVHSARQWYRVATSLFVTASLLEWVLVAVACWQLEKLAISGTSIPGTVNWKLWWPIIYMVGVGTGQLWMAAFANPIAISGCAGWGTAGVLCAMGVSRPNHRMPLFLTAIAILVLNLIQPTSNVFGAIGASFFGWSYFGAGLSQTTSTGGVPVKENDTPAKRWHCLNWLALITVLKLWILPILFIFFRK